MNNSFFVYEYTRHTCQKNLENIDFLFFFSTLDKLNEITVCSEFIKKRASLS